MIEYVCPRCKGKLESRAARYECAACNGVYPIIVGIPDFRVYPDPYISLEDDRAKGLRLAEAGETRDFAGVVEFYYSITPEVLPDQAQYFLRHHLAGVKRGAGIIERAKGYGLRFGGRGLDMGCGTCGLVAAAAQAGHEVVGIDYAFRWLVAGRKRLAELGCDEVQVAAACADALPFPDDSFDFITAENLLEHAAKAEGALVEAGRVGRRGSGFMARTVNRFAIGPEPHVGLWGVGFLPRRWMNPYVKRLKGIPYEHIHLLSVFDLKRMIRRNGLDWRVTRPLLTATEMQHHSPGMQRLFGLYQRLGEGAPPLRPLLTVFGPYVDVVAG